MAKDKTYTGEIDKNIPWDGNNNTNNLPVAGSSIETFLKKQLNRRFGVLYYDEDNNRYIAFADTEARDTYISDPVNNTGLVLGTWDAPAAYTITYNLLTNTTIYILSGTKGNYIEYTFDTVNKSNQSVGESVSVTYNFTNGNNKTSVKKEYAAGTTVQFLLDDYISTGTNRIQVVISGLQTLVSTSFLITYVVVQLDLTTSYNMSKVNKDHILIVPYTLTGVGTKTTEFYIDGNKVDALGEDTVTASSVSKSRSIDLSGFNLSDGIHSLQIRSYVVNNSQTFYSKTLYRNFILDVAGKLKGNYVGVGTDLPIGIVIASGANLELDVIQFEQFSLNYFAYSSSAISSIPVTIKLNGLTISSTSVANDVVNTWNYIARDYGSGTLHFITSSQDLSINLNVTQSSTGLTEVTSGLALKLSAVGRSNSDTNKSEWAYKGYSTTFNNFKWTTKSGWDGKALVMTDGANISINVKPFSGDVKATGMAIEVDFEAINVVDENAVIFACLNPDTGVGCKITGQMISMTSPAGTVCKTMYAANERMHVIFMMTKTSDIYHNLMLIYINGIKSATAIYQKTETFTGTETISVGNADGNAGIELYNLKTFTSNFTDDEAVNEYIISKEDSSELLELYNKNDIYDENGNVSIDKMSAICPVMKVTGDLDTLLATSDKNIKVTCDVDFIDLQDPTKSFTSTGTQFKLQGTSSLGYPRKNYKIDFGKGKLYDYNGNEVKKQRYVLYDGDPGEKTWTFKADYMDSSMSRNSGVARFWNDALYNAQIDGDYKLRTPAQDYAEKNPDKVGYKIRTTPNSKPIVIFYRETVDDDWIFQGQYNFLNDKGNDTLFGFDSLGDFDNSKTVCFEGLENTTLLSKFRDVSTFDAAWNNTWSFRFPDYDATDGLSPDELADRATKVAQLKNLVSWINSCNRSSDVTYGDNITISAEIKPGSNGTVADNDANRLLKFRMEKWDHLDVYKVAAYYVYLMRHGAVDQTIKNTFWTSFGVGDGGTMLKFFFINYDNDTIIDKINDGHIIYDWLFNRQTVSATTQDGENYHYMGHDSVFWNNLEADNEFMQIVDIVDNALYAGGMTYKSVMKMFDNKQRDVWPERIFNSNQNYKYLEPYYKDGTNNLFMLNGSLKSHDHWWLSHRYNLYDSIFVSGNYKGKNIEFKATSGKKSFTITSGESGIYFGYGINNDAIETGISIAYGESHTFELPRALAIGDPVRIYSAQNIKSIDLSPYILTLTDLSLGGAYDADSKATDLEEVILGNGTNKNDMLENISGLAGLAKLTKLDVRNYTKLTSLSLTSNTLLTTLLASGSGLGSVDLPEGSPISTLSLPAMKILLLNSLPDLTMSGLMLDDNGVALNDIEVSNCAGLSGGNMQIFVENWVKNRTTDLASCTLKIDNINWTNFSANTLISMGRIGELALKGKIVLSSITQSQYNQLTNLFGANIWNLDNALSVNAASGSFIGGPSEISYKSTGQFSATIFPLESSQTMTWTALDSSGNAVTGITIDSNGLLTVSEKLTADKTITVKVTSGSTSVSMSTICLGPIYPTGNSYLTAPGIINKAGDVTVTLNTVPANATGAYTVDWSVSGKPLTDGYVTIKSQSPKELVLNVNTIYNDNNNHDISITATLTRNDGNIYAIKATTTITDINYLFTKNDNAEVVAKMFASNKCASSYGMTQAECEAVTDLGTIFKDDTSLKSFDELQYFTGLTSLSSYCFSNCLSLTSITLPSSLKSLSSYCFNICSSLTSITIPSSITSLGSYCFNNCTSLTSITIPSSITSLGSYCFNNCKSLTSITIPNSITSLREYCFASCASLTSITLPNSITYLGDYCFASCTSLTSITLPNSITYLGDYCFNICLSLKAITLPSSITSLGTYCFNYCKSLTSITLPNSITSLGTYCFASCISLTSITLPNSITSLGTYCFASCISLTSITLPSSLTSLGTYCFIGCTKLQEIICEPTSAPTTTNNTFGSSSSYYTGASVEPSITKYLYVPSDATGYENTSGDGWAILLDATKCNFKISKTL